CYPLPILQPLVPRTSRPPPFAYTTLLRSFEASGSGFTATITLDRENLVFFSVPYDEGFTATVNGVETEIEYVSTPLTVAVKPSRSEEHTSELQSRFDLVCRLLLAKNNTTD